MQCHPTQPVVATSGIESVVKLWSPDGPAEGLDAVGASLRVNRNQERMSSQTSVSRGINQRLLAVSCCSTRAFVSRTATQTMYRTELPSLLQCLVGTAHAMHTK